MIAPDDVLSRTIRRNDDLENDHVSANDVLQPALQIPLPAFFFESSLS